MPPFPTDQIKLGIIGYGSFADFIYKAHEDSPRILFTVVADQLKSPEDLPEALHFVRDWKELLNDTSLDGVFISTPPHSHAEIALAFLEHGKHVMVEKPLSLTADDTRKIKEAALRNGTVVMVDFMQRFNPLLQQLHSLYTNGVLGSLERYTIENYAQDESLTADHWFWKQAISGGILLEHAVHFIDLVHWFSNKAVHEISGFGDKRNDEQLDRMGLTVQYEGGVIASHYHSFTRPNVFERTKMSFVFSAAQFEFIGWIPEHCTFVLLGNEENIQKLQILPNLKILKNERTQKRPVRGKAFDYTHIVEGTFNSSKTKPEIYRQSLIDIFNDFYTKCKTPSHTTRVGIDDAIKAVEIAEIATRKASMTQSDN